MLPQLVRRLVLANPNGITRVSFRAGEGVQLGGWDGIVEAEKGNSFVPQGASAWEMSVEKKVKSKADDDYQKRTAKPLGVVPAKSTFVFVTPRRWKGKDDWQSDRQKENTWSDVRVYDADDLEHWLETAPAIHLWISILLGKHPDGAEDLTSHWENWSAATEPAIPPDLVLAGREEVTGQIQRWFDNPVTPLVIRGESRAEAIAVCAAAIEKHVPNQREIILSRAALVHDLPSWNHLAASDSQLTLIAGFDCDSTAIAKAIRNKHSVILPLGHSDTATTQAVLLPRLSREGVEKILVENGVTEHEAREHAALARRSLTALRRKLAVVAEIEQPQWARPENARSLLPALLAGRWSGGMKGDQEVLAKLAGKPYDQFSAELVRWSSEDDPPVRCIDTTWYLTSEEDTWPLLGRFLTTEDVHRFQTIAIEVLGRSNPAFDLPDDQRWMAGVIGTPPEHSSFLRSGIATTLAIIGARGGGIRITGDSTLEMAPRRPVAQLLDSTDWKVWASLPLGMLAEAAPDEFLDAVDRGVAGDEPFLRGLFRDRDADMFSSPTHTDLLRALEALAWNEQLLTRIATALARLARIDPGGNWANRPLASLRAIFLLWLPRTKASLQRRFGAIDAIRAREPAIAWKVMTSLLPQFSDHSSPTARPHWREWAPAEDVGVTTIEFATGTAELVQRLLVDAGVDGTRWNDLIEGLPGFPPDQFGAAVAGLESLNVEQLDPNDVAAIWNALRVLVSKHRSYADADWSLGAEQLNGLATLLARFEPRDAPRRYGWLFGNNPALPEGREDDWVAYQDTIAKRQGEAVEAQYRKSGLNWVTEFIEQVERPGQLGAAFARSEFADDVADELLCAHLRPDEPHHREFVNGFVGTRVHPANLEWAIEKLNSLGSDWSPAQRAALCTCLPFDAKTWEVVDGCDEGTVSAYWKTVRPYVVDENQIESVARRLLEHGRPSVAAELMDRHVDGGGLPVELVLDVLERLGTGPADEAEAHRLSVHDLSDLLAYVSRSDEVDENRVARLEWAFLPVLGRHDHTPKILLREMARNPELFAEVVALVYRAQGEAPSDLSDEELARAERASQLLRHWRWRPLPGMPEDGTFDTQALADWILKARTKLKEQGRLAMGDHTIGEILSTSPGGDDGIWPHPAVRDIIEQLESEDFEQGLLLGILNSEGVSSRNPNEGGAPERSKAARYEEWADAVSDRWSRTSGLLRRLRDHYGRRADDEDRCAKVREELF